MVDFRKKGLDKKKVFVVQGEAPYFSEALSFSLPSLLVNPAMVTRDFPAFCVPRKRYTLESW